MAKAGRLTTQDKYIIQGMRHEGKSVEEISEFLDRTEKAVTNYLEGELDKIHSVVANNQLNENSKSKTPQTSELPQSPQSPQPIKLTSKDLMINTTEEGRKGTVAIMTEAASMKGDSHKQQYMGRVNRVFDKNIVRISDGKALERGDLINEKNEGPLTNEEMSLLVNMIKQNKSVKHIALCLNRDENEIAKIINGVKND
jgi:DNA-binding NarL/FixJ family response regulator